MVYPPPLRGLAITFFILLINLSVSVPTSSSSSIKLLGSNGSRSVADTYYCESRRLAAETNNAGTWDVIPSMCMHSVADYLNGDQFLSDYDIIVDYAIAFAKTVKISGDGKDAWVFDVDETLLNNIDYYKAHGYGTEPYDEKSFNEWIAQGTAPAYKACLRLYKALKKLGFTIIVQTGRQEDQRNDTERNLRNAGYSDWARLPFLCYRGPEDQNTSALAFKSSQRLKLVEKGFRIIGNVGDQWSDLIDFPLADRSFKIPNPMYHLV